MNLNGQIRNLIFKLLTHLFGALWLEKTATQEQQNGSRMNRILKVYDKSIFQFFEHIIKVNFPMDSSPISSSIKFNKTQEKNLNLIKEDGQITQKDIAIKLDMSDRAVRKAMATLIENDIVAREGSSRKGRWVIVLK